MNKTKKTESLTLTASVGNSSITSAKQKTPTNEGEKNLTKAKAPTEIMYDELQEAYRWFNKHIFSGKLRSCMITLNADNPKTRGHHLKEAYITKAGSRCDEIMMNPSWMAVRTLEESLSTLVHEMVHLEQAQYGKPGRGGYHNKAWVQKMKDIGLPPASATTGEKGLGDRVSHTIDPKGLYHRIFKEYEKEHSEITWIYHYVQETLYLQYLNDPDSLVGSGVIDPGETEFPDEGKCPPVDFVSLGIVIQAGKVSGTRSKYVCPDCGCAVWGKPGLNIICGDCNTEYKEKTKALEF